MEMHVRQERAIITGALRTNTPFPTMQPKTAEDRADHAATTLLPRWQETR